MEPALGFVTSSPSLDTTRALDGIQPIMRVDLMAGRTNPPSRAEMSADTRKLHDAVDDAIRRDSKPFLHPDGQSIQLDLLGSTPMIAWQEEKARLSFLAADCWSHLPTTYARYGSESTRVLLSAIRRQHHRHSVGSEHTSPGARGRLRRRQRHKSRWMGGIGTCGAISHRIGFER